jgi:N-methylhydantoinase B
MIERVRNGEHPTAEAMRRGDWGAAVLPAGVPERIALPEGSLLVDYVAGGGGFGDPLDRHPGAILSDFGRGWVSREVSEKIYGVIFTSDGKAVDQHATENRRREIRGVRRQGARRSAEQTQTRGKNGWSRLIQFHAALEIASNGAAKAIRCIRCNHFFCDANDNYKLYALHQVIDLNDLLPRLASGDPYIGEYHIYSCPGCATQLQVDMFTPALGGEPILWDTRIATNQMKPRSHKSSTQGARQ